MRLNGVWSGSLHAVELRFEVACLMAILVSVLIGFAIFDFDFLTVLELAILSPGLFVLASLLLLFSLSFQSSTTLISHGHELDPLCQDASCNLAILTPRAGFLTFYNEAGR